TTYLRVNRTSPNRAPKNRESTIFSGTLARRSRCGKRCKALGPSKGLSSFVRRGRVVLRSGCPLGITRQLGGNVTAGQRIYGGRRPAGRFRSWTRKGLWDKILRRLQARKMNSGAIDWSLFCIDGTVVRAHQSAAGASKKGPAGEPEDHAL